MIVFLFAVSDCFHADDAFFAGYVCQCLTGNAVADSVYAGNICFVIFVDRDLAFVCFYAQCFESNAFDVGGNTNCAQYDVGFEGNLAAGRFYCCFYAIAAGIHAGYFAAGHDLDALFFEVFLQFFWYFFIFNRHYAGQKLYDGYFGAYAIVEIAEFNTYSAAANDDDAFGLGGKWHAFAVADDFFTILFKAGQLTAAATRSHDDMTAFHDLFFAFGIAYFQLTGSGKFAKAHDHVNFVFTHQEVDSLAHFICNATAAFDDGIKTGCAGSFNTIRFGVADIICHLRAF